jgi:hypothetical protein
MDDLVEALLCFCIRATVTLAFTGASVAVALHEPDEAKSYIAELVRYHHDRHILTTTPATA